MGYPRTPDPFCILSSRAASSKNQGQVVHLIGVMDRRTGALTSPVAESTNHSLVGNGSGTYG